MLSFILATILFLTSSPLLSQAVFLDQTIEASYDVETSFPRSLGPKLTAESAIVVDLDEGKVLFTKNPDRVLPIASITKLMTSLVFLENNNRKWDEKILVQPEDMVINLKNAGIVEPAGLDIHSGQSLTLKDIFYATLIRSANDATKILSRLIDLSEDKSFVDLMNEKALLLGMNNTHFADATGLNDQNRSTVEDLVKLVLAAMKKDEIRQVLKIKYYDISIYAADGQKFYQRIWNTDKLLESFINLKGAKTGYLEESGYCFASLSNYQDRQLVVVILNATSDKDRFQEVKSLVWWAINH